MIDFLGIGAQKAGTTWLIANLAQHPKVWVPKSGKEVHYFDVAHLGTGRKFALATLARRCDRAMEGLREKGELTPAKQEYYARICDPLFAYTDEWYAHIFSGASPQAVKGEFTPLYCALPPEGIAHVKRLIGAAKLIYTIRDPVDRMLSSLKMGVRVRKKPPPPAELLGVRNFMARGDYKANIAAWEQAVQREKILYIPYGRIRTAPEAVLREVESHLGLERFDGYTKLTTVVHKAPGPGPVIDEATLGTIARACEPQYAYLEGRFGAEFCASMK